MYVRCRLFLFVAVIPIMSYLNIGINYATFPNASAFTINGARIGYTLTSRNT